MRNSREFDDSLGHAGADADNLNEFKCRAHEQSNIGGTAARTVYQEFLDGKWFRTAGNGNANEKTSAASSITNDVLSNDDVPVHCALNGNVMTHSSSKDLTTDVTAKHFRMLVCDCVKTVLLRRLKCYKKQVHGVYNFCNGSVVAALVIQCWNVQWEKVTEQWWNEISKLLGNTQMDHRNSYQDHTSTFWR